MKRILALINSIGGAPNSDLNNHFSFHNYPQVSTGDLVIVSVTATDRSGAPYWYKIMGLPKSKIRADELTILTDCWDILL